jgi:nucleotide-binding universal stress UspA family protein
MKVLVPIDQSAESEAALPDAQRLAREPDGEIVLVSVGELPETSEHEAQARGTLQDRLDQVAASMDAPVRTRVELAGDPVRGILEVAREEHADAIVMAAADGSSWTDLLSQEDVAEEVAEGTSRPVHIVRLPKR